VTVTIPESSVHVPQWTVAVRARDRANRRRPIGQRSAACRGKRSCWLPQSRNVSQAPLSEVPSDRAIHLAHNGTHRSAAVQLAEDTLTDGERVRDPRCFRNAVLTLVYAGDLRSAEAHCTAALARPEWRAHTVVRQEFTLLHARIRYLTGDCAGARHTIAGLLSGPDHHGPAVAWSTEILVARDELSLAEALLDASVATPAARAAVHLAADRFEPAVDDYLACGEQLSDARITNPAVVARRWRRWRPTASTSPWRWRTTSWSRPGGGDRPPPSAPPCTGRPAAGRRPRRRPADGRGCGC
jgi:hypothetical protein